MSLRGRKEGEGLALGTVGPQSSCGAFVADLIRGRLSPECALKTYKDAGEAKILNTTMSSTKSKKVFNDV